MVRSFPLLLLAFFLLFACEVRGEEEEGKKVALKSIETITREWSIDSLPYEIDPDGRPSTGSYQMLCNIARDALGSARSTSYANRFSEPTFRGKKKPFFIGTYSFNIVGEKGTLKALVSVSRRKDKWHLYGLEFMSDRIDDILKKNGTGSYNAATSMVLSICSRWRSDELEAVAGKPLLDRLAESKINPAEFLAEMKDEFGDFKGIQPGGNRSFCYQNGLNTYCYRFNLLFSSGRAIADTAVFQDDGKWKLHTFEIRKRPQ